MENVWIWYGKISDMDFDGAKLALISNNRVLTLLRDDRPDIPFPAMWDFPGGGSEEGETPEQCVLRELNEEFGVIISPARLTYKSEHIGVLKGQARVWFFGAVFDGFDPAQIRFGNEGQRWEMMPIIDYLEHPLAIGHLKMRLTEFSAILKH